MYATVTDDFIILTISSYEEEILLIEKKIDLIRRSLSDEQEMILAASLPGWNTREKEPSEPSSSFEKDLQVVYERYKKLSRIREEDGIAYVIDLYEKKDSMDRVLAAYRALPENEHNLLEILYVRYKDLPTGCALEKTQNDLFLSSRQVYRHRKKAFDHIRAIYESDKSILEIWLDSMSLDTNANDTISA